MQSCLAAEGSGSKSWGPVTVDDTATLVEQGDNGRVRITVAKPAEKSTTSLNRYLEFSSTEAGLEFENGLVGARTIVNQVTGSNATRLQGDIKVLGVMANVIIANRNGIYVNGARFDGVGGLALTTGELSSRTFLNALGRFQENMVATTNQGRIVIEEGGLSGAFSFVEIIAKDIEVRGQIMNTSTAPSSFVRLTAGDSMADFDSEYVPGDAARGWASIHAHDDPNSTPGGGQTRITITRSGTISASNIHVVVNERGAGVNMAGAALARAGDFTLTASGDVVLNGGTINAANQVKIAGRQSDGVSMKFHGKKDGAQRFAVSGDRGVRIAADSVKLEQGKVAAVGGPVEIIAGAGGIENLGSIVEGSDRAGHGVQLLSKGRIKNKSLSADDMAIISANDGDLIVQTESDLENYSGRFLSGGKMQLDVGGTLRNETLATTGRSRKESRRFRWYEPWNRGWTRKSAEFGELVIPGGIAYFTATKGLTINSTAVYNYGGEFNANGGSLTINTRFLHNEAFRTGRHEFEDHRKWWVVKSASGTSNVATYGGNISSAGSMDISAKDGVRFQGGRLFALDDIRLNSAYLRGEALPNYQLYEGPQGLRELWSGKRRAILTSMVGAEVTSGTGRIYFDLNRNMELRNGRFSAPKGVHGSSWEDAPKSSDPSKAFSNEQFGFFGDALNWD